MRPTIALAALLAASAAAGADPRIRELAFDAASVVTIAAKPGVTTMVQFAPDEHVKSVATGQAANCSETADPWCVSWPANAGFVFVRPKTRARLPLALAVVTDRHVYSLVFEPLAARAARPAIFRLSFTYPQPKSAQPKSIVTAREERSQEAEKPIAMARPLVSGPELVAERLRSEALPVNANYTIAYGRNSEDLQPAMVFDDGRFTYIKWPGNREIPAIFEIRTDGSEMVANTRMQGELIVVDRIARGLMLRSGSAVASIKNESFESEGLAPVGGTTVPGVERAMRE
jgi:type IV secretion system protein VirB9